MCQKKEAAGEKIFGLFCVGIKPSVLCRFWDIDEKCPENPSGQIKSFPL
jgi:hypothetical protein